jgi:serine/threonine-protein kinase
VYALGVTLYEMLAGRAPFEGEFASVLAQHLSQPPPPLRDFCGDVPEEINVLISTMLAKPPENRAELSVVIGTLSAAAESA